MYASAQRATFHKYFLLCIALQDIESLLKSYLIQVRNSKANKFFLIIVMSYLTFLLFPSFIFCSGLYRCEALWMFRSELFRTSNVGFQACFDTFCVKIVHNSKLHLFFFARAQLNMALMMRNGVKRNKLHWYFTHLHPMIWIFKRFWCSKWLRQNFCHKKMYSLVQF